MKKAIAELTIFVFIYEKFFDEILFLFPYNCHYYFLLEPFCLKKILCAGCLVCLWFFCCNNFDNSLPTCQCYKKIAADCYPIYDCNNNQIFCLSVFHCRLLFIETTLCYKFCYRFSYVVFLFYRI